MSTTSARTPPSRLAWDSRPADGGRRGAPGLVTAGLLVLPVGLVATLLRVFPPSDDVPALLASFISYAVVPYAFATVMFALALIRTRRRIAVGFLTTLSAALLAMHVTWLAPLFVPDDRPVTSAPFTVLSLNIRAEGADPAAVAAAARRADIVVLVEVTPTAAAHLVEDGIRTDHPYEAGETLYRRTGSMIYSRFPLSAAEPLPTTKFPMWAVTADVPEVGPVRVFAVHPCNPFCGTGRWPGEHEVVTDAVADAPDGPVVVAGDFNAVDDHGPMRRLRSMGLRSATDLAGAGWLPTYPADARIPPLIPIDHVLVDDRLTATAVERVRIGGTDHLGLLATLAGSR